jgi:hypothetical protein
MTRFFERFDFMGVREVAYRPKPSDPTRKGPGLQPQRDCRGCGAW